jgi:hypothetical protein
MRDAVAGKIEYAALVEPPAGDWEDEDERSAVEGEFTPEGESNGTVEPKQESAPATREPNDTRGTDSVAAKLAATGGPALTSGTQHDPETGEIPPPEDDPF